MLSLNDILELEDTFELESAFYQYQLLYSERDTEFNVWQHYYFFLWFTEAESQALKGGMEFTQKYSIEKHLKPLFDEGYKKFNHLAEFNFISGYTISMFPYYYGNYEEMEVFGKQLMAKAAEVDPLNPLYKASYMSSFPIDKLPKGYAYYWNLTKTSIWPKYLGKGFLNGYMRNMISKPCLP